MMVRSFSLSLLALLVLLAGSPASAEVKGHFLHPLSNFSGPVPSLWARLAVDTERNEVYALNGRANDIRIFDEHGMEIYVFGEAFPTALDIAVGRGGDIFLLTAGPSKTAALHLLDYRGEHVSEISLKGVPAAFSEFVPDQFEYRGGLLYLVDSDALLVVVIDEGGVFKKGYDLNVHLRPWLPREKRADKTLKDFDWARERLEFIALDGFFVAKDGSMFFTIAVLFSAFQLFPDGELVKFGRPGSGPGKFGVAAGIAVDDDGYVYVSDRLRSVVMVFDPSFTFRTEFGYRGLGASNLIVPDDLVIDRRGQIYVAQAANRGVSVFRVVHDEIIAEPVVREIANPFKASSFKSKEISPTVSEKSGQTVEEDVSDAADSIAAVSAEVESIAVEPDQVDLVVDVPEQAEFVVDQGGDALSTDSEQSGWHFEENEADHSEEN
jgi:DNA-binding beta-propeller fold protein YncE